MYSKMITKQLNVGDYIFNAKGELARITKVNKKTYSYVVITNYGSRDNVSFNGIKTSRYYYGSGATEEWFECEDATAKALELAFKQYKKSKKVERQLEETKELIANAKWYLEQIKDIEAVYPQVEKDDDYDYYNEDEY